MPLVKILDKISSWAGMIASWICIPLTLVVVYEVAMRHIFNMPSKWGYDTCWMLFAAQFMIGSGYTHLNDGHIRIDIVYNTLSKRNQMIFNAALGIIVILPVMALFTWAGIGYAAEAWASHERLSTSMWMFPAGPPRTLIPLGFLLLGLQALAEVIRNIVSLREKEQP